MKRNLRRTILVIDDNILNLDILKKLLKDEYSIKEATDGSMGIEIANKLKPDLILLDVVMPGLSGYEVCYKLKSNPKTKDIPVIFITALSDQLDEAKAFDLGAIDYITKPFNPIIVKKRVETQIQKLRSAHLEAEVNMFDKTTGVYNRSYIKRIDDVVKKNYEKLGVMLVGVYDMRIINEYFGSSTGNGILKRVGEIIETAMLHAGDHATIRFSDDEFLVVIYSSSIQLLQEWKNHIEELFINDEFLMKVRISIGLDYREKDSSFSDMIKNSHISMYKDKLENQKEYTLEMVNYVQSNKLKNTIGGE